MKGRLRVLPWATTVALFALAIPATASASKMSWVSNSAPVGANTSCASPGFNTVQAALDAAEKAAKINVCGGTYVEQIQITKGVKIGVPSGSGTAKLVMPSTPSESTTECDTAVPGGQTDEISICNVNKVNIKGLTIEARAPIATCAGALNAINVGEATLDASYDTIIGASTTLDAYKGCQKGVAVLVGAREAKFRGSRIFGRATLSHDTISGYEKNGPTVVNGFMNVLNTSVTGEGPSPFIAQNGIEAAFGGHGTVKNSTISGDECELAGACSSNDIENQADGVLFYQAGVGSSVSNSTISDNDLGVYYSSGSSIDAPSPQVKIVSNTLSDNRYEGVLVEEGRAEINSDTITGGGELGIAILQASFQKSESDSTASKSTIEGMSVAAVGVLTEGTGPEGIFTIKDSSISKNAAEVSNSSPNFTVFQKNNK